MPRPATAIKVPGCPGSGAEMCLQRAQDVKAGRIVRRQRMQPGHVGALARGYRDDLMAEVQGRRPKGKLSVADWAYVDAAYWATCGLMLAYGHLTEHGWINDGEHAFFPLVESVSKLHKCLGDALAKLGVDVPQKPKTIMDDYGAAMAMAKAGFVPDAEEVEGEATEPSPDAATEPVDAADDRQATVDGDGATDGRPDGAGQALDGRSTGDAEEVGQ